MAGEWSSPNLVALLMLACSNRAAVEPFKALRVPRFWLKLCHAINRNTRRGSRRNIAAHYDLGNDFYQQWLDAGMTYSAGLFSSADQTLEEAQTAKLDRVIDMLDLTGGERVLEIGCGWGSLAERMMDRHDCAVTGITLSAEQLAFAQAPLHYHDIRKRCDLRLQDYRDVSGTFDRIVSIEMLEAVGESYWSHILRQDCEKVCAPGGLPCCKSSRSMMLDLRTIVEGLTSSRNTSFPAACCRRRRSSSAKLPKRDFKLESTEFFGESYARTLQEWQMRFQRAWSMIERLGFDDRFKKTWEYYLAYCQSGFEASILNVGLYKISQIS